MENIVEKTLKYLMVVFFLFLPQTFAVNYLYSSTNSNAKQIDSSIVNYYIDNAYDYAFYNPDSALYFIDSAISMAEKTGYKNGISEALHVKGIIYYAIDKYDSALNNYYRALNMRIAKEDLSATAATISNIALTYTNLSLYELAIKNNLEALKIRESIDDSAGIAKSLNNLGMNYHQLKEYKMALKFYREALSYKRRLGVKKDIGSTLNNLGQLYFDWGYENAHYFDSAASYLFKAVNIREEIKDIPGLSESLFNLGNVYIQKNQYDKATIFIDDAYQKFKILGDKYGMASVYFNKGYIEYNKEKPNNDRGLANFNKSITIAKEIKSLELLQDNYLNVSNIYKSKKQYDNAYQYMELYDEIKDSILTVETRKEIARLQIQYETKKREKLIASQKSDIKMLLLKNNRLFIFTIILSVIVIIMAVIIFSQRRKKFTACIV